MLRQPDGRNYVQWDRCSRHLLYCRLLVRCESERLDRGHFCGLALFTPTDEMMGEALGERWATLRELLPFYGALGKSGRTPSWLVFRFETIPSASSNRVRRIFCRSCSQ